MSPPPSFFHPANRIRERNEGGRQYEKHVSSVQRQGDGSWQSRSTAVEELYVDDVGGQSGPFLSVTSHYAPKQTWSSSIFYLQWLNTNDSSFGYSSLGDHMATMIMPIRQNQSDPRWWRLATGLLQSERQLIRLSTIISNCTMAISSAVARCRFTPFCCCSHLAQRPLKDLGRTLDWILTIKDTSNSLRCSLRAGGYPNFPVVCSKYLSGVVLDILCPVLVPICQKLDGRGSRTEPQQLRWLLIQKGIIVQQILVQRSSEGKKK